MKGKFAFFAIIVFIIIAAAGCIQHNFCEDRENIRNWAYQLQYTDANEAAISGFKLIVMDYSRDGSEEKRYTYEEIQKIKDAGATPIAYISIGEAEDYRFYWNEEWKENPPEWLGKENPNWPGNYAVKYWSTEWKNIIFSYIDKIIEEGFLGVYLDKVDEFEYWSDEESGEGEVISESEAAARMIDFILEIADYTREKAGKDFYIIPQNGERILKYDDGRLMKVISGWAVEDVFYNGLESWSEDEKKEIERERLPYLRSVIENCKFVLSVEYIDDGSGYKGENKKRIDDYISKASKEEFVPYVAIYDRELDELNIIEGVQP